MPDGLFLAVEAWNMMGGELNWQAIPILVDMLEVQDVEKFIREIVQIRNFKNADG